MAEGVRALGSSLTLLAVVAVPGEVGGLGRGVAWGAKESGRPSRSASVKWEPPGRMDSAMSDLATWMRRLSSMVQRPASKRLWARDE